MFITQVEHKLYADILIIPLFLAHIPSMSCLIQYLGEDLLITVRLTLRAFENDASQLIQFPHVK